MSELPKMIWGVVAIGEVINRSKRQVQYMLANGWIPARRIGGRWVADRDQLLKIADPEKEREGGF